MKRELLSILLASTVIMGTTSCVSAENGGLAWSGGGTKIIYDGTEITFDAEPVNMDGTIMVPMRAVFEALGTKVKWD